MAASITAVRRKIHTGFPRHSTICRAPGASSLMSASTGAPAAFARSELNLLPVKAVAAPAAATPSTMLVAMSRTGV